MKELLFFFTRMLNRRGIKFLVWFLVIVGVGAAVFSYGAYFNPEARERRMLLEYFDNLEDEYRNDTYGGATPEETLALFIAALEAGDIELASKYFLPDERDGKQKFLQAEFDVDGNFGHVIVGLKQLKRVAGIHNPEEEAFFSIVDKNNVVTNQVVLQKNENSVWKITEL